MVLEDGAGVVFQAGRGGDAINGDVPDGATVIEALTMNELDRLVRVLIGEILRPPAPIEVLRALGPPPAIVAAPAMVPGAGTPGIVAGAIGAPGMGPGVPEPHLPLGGLVPAGTGTGGSARRARAARWSVPACMAVVWRSRRSFTKSAVMRCADGCNQLVT